MSRLEGDLIALQSVDRFAKAVFVLCSLMLCPGVVFVHVVFSFVIDCI